jgi:hypothetical protein
MTKNDPPIGHDLLMWVYQATQLQYRHYGMYAL